MMKKESILYVDDEPINLLIFRKNFEKSYNIITAESGFQGLERLKNNPAIRTVISDMKMPGMTGVEFIRIAKKEHPEIVFFILTGFDITKEISEALTDKVIHQYFRKPINIKEIESAINSVI